MTTLHLISDAGGRSGSVPAKDRPSGSRPRLELVPDTGASYRSPASKAEPARRHSPLTLAVAAAAIAAAILTPTAFDREGDANWFPVRMSVPSLS